MRARSVLYLAPKIKIKTWCLLSYTISYLRGLRQGCPSSPILFDIYFSDLLDGLDSGNELETNIQISRLLFGNDAVLLANTTGQLKRDMLQIDEWCKQWWISLCVAKCEILWIMILSHFITVYGEELSIFSNYVNISPWLIDSVHLGIIRS